uniref:MYND-type domain-containing protein n=1 Tax=Oryza rufipogon TaxID=4529 RepID=A0A0E0R8I2_ORYRU
MRSPRRRRGVHPAAATAPPCSAMASGAASPRSPPAAKKRAAVVAGDGDDSDVFDRLPDDIVLVVLSRLAANAASPADVASAALTCRRFRELATHPAVLSRASAAAVAVRWGAWSEAAHRFLLRCAAAGSLHACYFLGMVRFYCLGSRATGAALLGRAAGGGHAPALYALAVVQFNGSGGGKADKDARAGVALCARAAWLGHTPALRELGHCLQDGYGARRDAPAGRRLLLHAAAREHLSWKKHNHGHHDGSAAEDAVSRFMVAWWDSHRAKAAARGCLPGEHGDGEHDGGEDLRLCSHARCGRRETRRHEFRRCSVCGAASYCSRACQALDWKRAHRAQCAAARWLAAAAAADGVAH